MIGVAVVGGDQCGAALSQNRIDYTAYAGVNGFDGFDSRVKHAGVTDHVAVSKVQDDHVIFAAFHSFDHFVRHFVRAHFGLQIVRGHFRGMNQNAVFAFVLGFHAAVKEERHMGVLFGFGNAQLLQAQTADIFAQGVVQALFLEGHFHVGHGGVIGVVHT